MLEVATPQEAAALIDARFGALRTTGETVPLNAALGRVLAADIQAGEDVPGFDRSTVDGYAVRAADTFGCSDALPALLTLAGAVTMGTAPTFPLCAGQCAAVPTGGQLPDGADAMVMVEYTEDYGDGTVGILKPVAPGANRIYRGDDVRAGEAFLHAGKRLEAHELGALAALGIGSLPVARRPRVGILSTGDELVPIQAQPAPGQVRDVNSTLLAASVRACGGEAQLYGICRDEDGALLEALRTMARECDLLLLSGGSSVGEKDAAPRLIAQLGALLLHGIAIKPGKPTIIGEIERKPVFGLPGHPVAAYHIFNLFVAPLIRRMLGEHAPIQPPFHHAVLTAAIPSNHGRAECVSVRLTQEDACLYAAPVMGKSGLIALLAGTDGYILIPRGCEGLARGETVNVIPYGRLPQWDLNT